MSVIIRLQNLPWSANALDIRQFFHGLSIPEGGVHIVGGELGDAFIAFSTDEDARQAFSRNNGKIKEIQVSLMLSSRTEMQRVIEAARAQSYAAFMPPTAAVPMPAAVPAVIPAAVPELKREEKEGKRDRRRSRSKSRERKDRSRDRDRRDRRHRDRSRSRSRERRERRRRDRSRSRSRDRDRVSRDRSDRKSRDSKKGEERSFSKNDTQKPSRQVWSNQSPTNELTSHNSVTAAFGSNNEEPRRNVTSNLNIGSLPNNNGFQSQTSNFNNGNRTSWPPNTFLNSSNQSSNFMGTSMPNNLRMGNQFGMSSMNPNSGNFHNRKDNFQNRNTFQRQDNSFDDKEENYEENCCVQLFPFYGGYGDIRRFFQGSFISNRGIKFINDESGFRTGTVLIQFGHQQGKIDALRKSHENLNGIKVEITHIDDEEFETAVDRYMPLNSRISEDDESNGRMKTKNITKYFNKPQKSESDIKDFSCVIVDDLPTYVKEQDILHLFSSHPLFSLILTTKPKGGNIAYVKFSTKEVAKKAFDEKQNHIVNGKPVTVKPCTDADFDLINKQHEVDIDGGKCIDIGTNCLCLSRLPQKTNDRDIADFFSDIGVIPLKIHLVSNTVGFSGEAYCEFENNDEASRAAKKDDTLLGNVHVSVKPVQRIEMLTQLGMSTTNVSSDQSVVAKLSQNSMSGLNQSRTISNQNDSNMQNNMNPNMMHQNRPMHPMNQRPFFNRNFNGPGFMGPRGGPRFGPRSGGPRHRFGPPPSNMEGLDDAAPGCTVYMDNVPYKAGTNEILEFFDGYDVTNNVSRRYNPNNTPSAEARVVFHSPEEAFRAVQEKNGEKIWERPIFLRQA